MGSSKATADKYRQRYVELGFERAGLFQVLLERLHPRDVLYLGCSILASFSASAGN